jgi:serine protease Do
MKSNIKKMILPAFLLGAMTLAAVHVSAQEKEKEKPKKSEKMDEYDQLIIKRKGGMDKEKDVKVVIELKGDEVIVNGKPLNEFDDDDLAILKNDISIIDGRRYRVATPRTPRSAFNEGGWSWSGDGQAFTLEPDKAFLGVSSTKGENGVIITEVTKESGAAKAGLKTGDIITTVSDQKITTPEELSKAIGKRKPDDKVTVTYLRGGKKSTVTVTLGKRTQPYVYNFKNDFDHNFDHNFNQDFNFSYNGGQPKLGLKAQDTDDGKGVKVLDIDDESAAEKAGLEEGDIITSLDGKDIKSVTDLVEITRAARDAKKASMPIKYLRDNKPMQAELKIPRKLKTAEL